MCELISWVEYPNNKIYYLTDDDIFSEYGQQKLVGCKPEDYIGHGVIRQYYDLPLNVGVNKEVSDFWNTDKLPDELAQKVKTFWNHWGKCFNECLSNVDYCWIIKYGPPKYKSLTWKQFLKNNPSTYDYRWIIEYGPPKYKTFACKQLLKNNPSNYDYCRVYN